MSGGNEEDKAIKRAKDAQEFIEGELNEDEISRPGPYLPMDAWAEQRKSCAARVNLCVLDCQSPEVGFTPEQVHAMAHLFKAMIDSHEANRGTK